MNENALIEENRRLRELVSSAARAVKFASNMTKLERKQIIAMLDSEGAPVGPELSAWAVCLPSGEPILSTVAFAPGIAKKNAKSRTGFTVVELKDAGYRCAMVRIVPTAVTR